MKFKFADMKTMIWAGLFLVLSVGIFYAPTLAGAGYLWEDLLFYSYPSAKHFSAALQEGRFPLWITGMRDGAPFYTDIALTAFYPPLWILALLAPGGKLTVSLYQFYLAGQVVAAGAFMGLLLRAYRLHVLAVLTGMAVFMFSAFFSLHYIHVNVVTAFLWLPLQCFFVKRIVEAPSRWGHCVGFVVATVMSFFAGFPQVVIYNSYFVVAYWMWLYIQKETSPAGWKGTRLAIGLGKQIVLAGLLFLVTLMLGAVQLVPGAENWSLSHRQEFGFDAVSDLSLPWYYLLHGLVPNFFGSTSEGGGVPFWGVNKDTIGYRTWHSGGWMYWEFGFYAGQLAVIAIVAFFFNFRRAWQEKRELMFFLVAIPVVILLMAGRYGGLFNLFYHVAPGFAMFRSPARIGCLFDMCAAVMAAGYVDVVLKRKGDWEFKRPLWVLGGLYVVLFFWVLIYGSERFPELSDPLFLKHALQQMGVSAGIFLGTTILLLGVQSAARGHAVARTWPSVPFRWKMSVLMGCVAVLAYVDLYVAFHRFQCGKVNPDDYYADRNGLIAQMGKLREQQGAFRFAQLRDGKISEEVIFPRNIGYLYPAYEAWEGYLLFNLKEWGNFNAMTNDRARLDIQNVGIIANASSQTRQVGLMRYTNALPRVKFYHGLRAYPDTKAVYADLESGRLDYRRAAGVLAEDCVRLGLSTGVPPMTAEASVTLVPVTPEQYRIEYRTTAPGVIFISESYYPGWKANEGRLPIIKVFGAFKGIVIPEAGQGVITVKFVPRVLSIGLAISGVTLGLLILVLVVVVRRRKAG